MDRRAIAALGGAMLLLFLVAAACGGGDGDGGTTSTATGGQADAGGSATANTGTATVISWKLPMAATYQAGQQVRFVITVHDADGDIGTIYRKWERPPGVTQNWSYDWPASWPAEGLDLVELPSQVVTKDDIGTHTVTIWVTDKAGHTSNILKATFQVTW